MEEDRIERQMREWRKAENERILQEAREWARNSASIQPESDEPENLTFIDFAKIDKGYNARKCVISQIQVQHVISAAHYGHEKSQEILRGEYG
jgi:hypothetical protein